VPCIPGPVCSLIPLPARVTREELAEIGKRLLSITRGAVLLLRGDYRALSGILALLRAFPSVTHIRKALLYLPRTLPSLILTWETSPAILQAVEFPSSSVRPSQLSSPYEPSRKLSPASAKPPKLLLARADAS